MLATLEKIPETDLNSILSHPVASSEKTEVQLGTFELDMPDDTQAALDRLITYYKVNALKPVIELSGTPLDICTALVSRVRESVPQNMDTDARHVLDYIIMQIVDFCRTRQAKHLSLRFRFEREGKNIRMTEAA